MYTTTTTTTTTTTSTTTTTTTTLGSPVNFSVTLKDGIHEEELKWLKEELKKANEAKEKVLVLTHHTPTLIDITADCEEEEECTRIGLHGTELNYLFPCVHTWCFGHTHWNIDHRVTNSSKSWISWLWDKESTSTTRLVTNQRGYPDEYMEMHDPIWKKNKAFNIDMVVEV